MSDLPYVNRDGVLAGWRSGHPALVDLHNHFAEPEQTPRMIAEVIDLLTVEQRVRDASDRAVAQVLGREWWPGAVPPLLRLAEGGRDGRTRPGSDVEAWRVASLVDTSASHPDGVAGWYPALPGWDDPRFDEDEDEDDWDELPPRLALLEVDPVLALWDGRDWTGHVLTDPIVEVRGSGFAMAMARPRLLAAGRQALLLRFLIGLGPDATPADLVAAALLRGWIERHAGGWTSERSVVPDAVTAPPEDRARRRAVDVLRRQPAGWYEVLPPLDPALCDAWHADKVLNDLEAAAAVRAGYATCHVREWDGTAWVQRGADVDGEAAEDLSGFSVALSEDGETVAIGAPDNDDAAGRAGHVRVFTSAVPVDDAGAVSPPTVSCGPSPVTVGATVTCTITGGDPGIDILWRAAYNPVFAEAGVTLAADGTGTFSFFVPAGAVGSELTVELVEWTAPVSLGVVGGPVPSSVPSGEGPSTVVPIPAWAFVLLVLAGSVALRRRMPLAG